MYNLYTASKAIAGANDIGQRAINSNRAHQWNSLPFLNLPFNIFNEDAINKSNQLVDSGIKVGSK